MNSGKLAHIITTGHDSIEAKHLLASLRQRWPAVAWPVPLGGETG
jgi:hypothetical protein